MADVSTMSPSNLRKHLDGLRKKVSAASRAEKSENPKKEKKTTSKKEKKKPAKDEKKKPTKKREAERSVSSDSAEEIDLFGSFSESNEEAEKSDKRQKKKKSSTEKKRRAKDDEREKKKRRKKRTVLEPDFRKSVLSASFDSDANFLSTLSPKSRNRKPEEDEILPIAILDIPKKFAPQVSGLPGNSLTHNCSSQPGKWASFFLMNLNELKKSNSKERYISNVTLVFPSQEKFVNSAYERIRPDSKFINEKFKPFLKKCQEYKLIRDLYIFDDFEQIRTSKMKFNDNPDFKGAEKADFEFLMAELTLLAGGYGTNKSEDALERSVREHLTPKISTPLHFVAPTQPFEKKKDDLSDGLGVLDFDLLEEEERKSEERIRNELNSRVEIPQKEQIKTGEMVPFPFSDSIAPPLDANTPARGALEASQMMGSFLRTFVKDSEDQNGHETNYSLLDPPSISYAPLPTMPEPERLCVEVISPAPLIQTGTPRLLKAYDVFNSCYY